MALLLNFRRPPGSPPDNVAREGGRTAMRTGRSWWSVRYTDGRIISEWEPQPASPNRHWDWPMLPRRGRQSVRLYCPNGKMAELGASVDATGKLWQLKVAARGVSLGSDGLAAPFDGVLAHVIGMVDGLSGETTIYAWEILPQPGPPRLMAPPPNPDSDYFRTAAPGTFDRAYQAWRREAESIKKDPVMIAWAQRVADWHASGHGRLVGPINDNVYNVAYHKIGAVSADVLGIDDGGGR